MKRIAIAVLTLASIKTNAQDVITKKNGDDIKAHVIEVNQNEIKYKRQESPNGPLYTLSKSDILLIRYKDGTKDVFAAEQPEKNGLTEVNHEVNPDKPAVEINNSNNQSNEERIKAGKKAYLKSSKGAGKEWGEEQLRHWKYWQIVDREEDADLTINFIVEQKALAFDCRIEVINPQTKEVIMKTKGSACYAADVLNPKKGAIDKNIKEKLIPLVTGKTK